MRYHPLWTHTPAMVMTGYLVWRLSGMDVSDRMTMIHTSGTSSVPTIGVIGSILLMAVFYLVMSVFFDESWAKNEQPRKSFNWMSLFDEIAIALLISSLLWRTTKFTASEFGWMMASGAVLAGCLLEMLRPYRAEPCFEAIQPSGLLAVKSGANWLFFQRQNPPYINGLVLVLGVMMISQGVSAVQRGDILLAVINVPIIGLLLSLWNGMRVSVSPSRISVRLGMYSWKLLDLKPEQILNAEVAHFSPIRDFGGWGIRISPSKKGFFFEGTHGVLITPKKGMPVLVGSNQPQELLQAVRTAMGCSFETM